MELGCPQKFQLNVLYSFAAKTKSIAAERMSFVKIGSLQRFRGMAMFVWSPLHTYVRTALLT